jgi:hypothetical protein
VRKEVDDDVASLCACAWNPTKSIVWGITKNKERRMKNDERCVHYGFVHIKKERNEVPVASAVGLLARCARVGHSPPLGFAGLMRRIVPFHVATLPLLFLVDSLKAQRFSSLSSVAALLLLDEAALAFLGTHSQPQLAHSFPGSPIPALRAHVRQAAPKVIFLTI